MTLTGASGGAAADAEFEVSVGNSTALGFSFSGNLLPASDGALLTNLEFEIAGGDLCVSDALFSSTEGNGVTPSAGTCVVLPSVLSLGSLTSNSLEVLYSSPSDIGGFQFGLSGVTVTGASGGAAEEAGFDVSAGSVAVLGMSFTGASIPAGEGVLTNLAIEYIAAGEACLTGIVVSSPDASGLDFSAGDCVTLLCVEDCAGVCFGDAELDECGECNGDGIADGACDCAGNVADCAGVCGGSATLVTVCEDTDGDGYGNPGTETDQCVESSREDISSGCELPNFNLYLDGGSVYYASDQDIGGFQFNVDGATVGGASGGDAASNGFTVSAGGTTVLGFSFSGAVIPAGCGIMTELSLNGEATGLSGIVIADSNAGSLPFIYYIPGVDSELVADCSDEYPDCSSNTLDCGSM